MSQSSQSNRVWQTACPVGASPVNMLRKRNGGSGIRIAVSPRTVATMSKTSIDIMSLAKVGSVETMRKSRVITPDTSKSSNNRAWTPMVAFAHAKDAMNQNLRSLPSTISMGMEKSTEKRSRKTSTSGSRTTGIQTDFGRSASTATSPDTGMAVSVHTFPEGSEAIPKGSRSQATPKRAAPHRGEDMVPSAWRHAAALRGGQGYKRSLPKILEQHYDLRRTTATNDYYDIQQAALQGGKISDNPIFTGAIGLYNGTILHEAFRLPVASLSNNSNTDTNARGRAVFCGAQAAVMAYGRDGGTMNRMDWVEELKDRLHALRNAFKNWVNSGEALPA